MDSKNMNSER